MSKTISEEEYFAKLAQLTSQTVEELKTEFEAVLAEVKADEKLAGFTEEQYHVNARNRFALRKTRESGIANLVLWEGVILGIGDLIDMVDKQKKLTIASFKKDAMKTIAGTVFGDRMVQSTPEGVPVYPKTDENIKYKRAGKPLPEHSWVRNMIVYVRPVDAKTKQAGPAQLGTFVLRNEAAINISKIPQMTPVKFKAINKTTDEDKKLGIYRINNSTYTKFEPTVIPDMPPLENILPTITSKYRTLGELEQYHIENEKDGGRWCITEGSVTYIKLEANKVGNFMMIITDETLLFSGTDKTGVTCWIPSDRNIKLDFGPESRVFVVGKTTRGKGKDPVTGEYSPDISGEVAINVYGIYAPEIFKVPADVLPVTEKSLTAQPTEEEF